MRKLFAFAMSAALFTSCDTLSKIPTNTSGGLFTLNGNWQLTSSSDANAQVGTVVYVLPVVSNGTVRTVSSSNPYCYNAGTEIWRSIRGNGTGGFTVSNLVSACNGTSVYKEATISAAGNNAISVVGTKADGTALTQNWTRLKNN